MLLFVNVYLFQCICLFCICPYAIATKAVYYIRNLPQKSPMHFVIIDIFLSNLIESNCRFCSAACTFTDLATQNKIHCQLQSSCNQPPEYSEPCFFSLVLEENTPISVRKVSKNQTRAPFKMAESNLHMTWRARQFCVARCLA